MCQSIRFSYVLDSIYTKSFYTIMKDYKVIFENEYMNIKGFSLGWIMMIFMKLGQKSINSCKGPFTSSLLHIATSYYLRASISIMTS